MNQIILHGIFEHGGIAQDTDITDAEFKISLLINQEVILDFVTYYQTKWIKNDLDFLITIEPRTTRYNNALLKIYSKKCRTTFGDEKCKIQKDKFTEQYYAEYVTTNIIKCFNMQKENSYFKNGIALIEDREYQIKSHFNDQIELYLHLLTKNINPLTVLLTPSCDKNFGTCCKRFNNAVNFRGEPNIPENNFLKS